MPSRKNSLMLLYMKLETTVWQMYIRCSSHQRWENHIVEWDKTGNASECEVGGRDFREIRWNEEEQRPEYIHTKLLLHDDRFNVQVDASK